MNNVVHHACMDTVINTWLIAAGLDIQAGRQIGLCVESYVEGVARVRRTAGEHRSGRSSPGLVAGKDGSNRL